MPLSFGNEASPRRVASVGPVRALVVVLAAASALLVSGCLTLDGQPCPQGGSECPLGQACIDGSCEPVGTAGATAVVHAGLDDSVDASRVRRVLFESYQDASLECWLHRDPSDEERFAELEPDVQAPITLDEGTDVRVPAGRHLVLLRGLGSDGAVVAQACTVQDFPEGGARTLWLSLIRADGRCGDSFLDFGEQCDDGEEGSALCNPSCASRPIALATGASCITAPTAACTRGSDGDGRCLIGWVEDGVRLQVIVQHLDGRDDTEADRGLSVEGEAISQPLMATAGDQASIVWLQGGELRGTYFNFVGQDTESFTVEGDASSAARVVSRYVSRNDETVLVAGWIDDDGGVLLEQISSAERWAVDLPAAPADDLVAVLFSNSIAVAWTDENASGDPPTSNVVGAWMSFVEGTGSEAPTIIPDATQNNQRSPAAVAVGGGRVFYAWTDSNNALEGGDRSGRGIRGRRVTNDDGTSSVPINTEMSGDQADPVVVSGDGYVVVAWTDEERGELRARYLENNGAPLNQPFDEGLDVDFVVDDGSERVGQPAMATTDRIFFLWLEDDSGCDAGGHRLMMRLLPPPLH